MTDPDGANDTEPNAIRSASTDLGADTDPTPTDMTDTVPSSPPESDARPSEVNTEDFLDWLPTLWLGQRRRKELVQRRSSDGADFVAYASSGRPVAGVSVPAEPSVQVQTTLLSEAAAGRDAPTVFVPRRRGVSRQRVAVGLAVASLVATIALVASTHRTPRTGDADLAPRAAASLGQGPGALTAPTASMARSAAPTGATTEDPAAHSTQTRKNQGPGAVAPLVKESPRKGGGSRVGSSGHDAAAAARQAQLPETPAKDRYFEQP